jgi:hypothetical protein
MISNRRIGLYEFWARLFLLEMLPGARRIAGLMGQGRPARAIAAAGDWFCTLLDIDQTPQSSRAHIETVDAWC